MDCHEPVDDYCHALQADHLQIPPNSSDSDQFFIAIEVEVTQPSVESDSEDDDGGAPPDLRVYHLETLGLWVPCPRTERGNLPASEISGMLSRAGVPLHKHKYMTGQISLRADEIANAARNKGTRVLPMQVFISIVACSCYGEAVVDP
ncbi:SH3 and PX domain-containing protein 2A [Striga asiatica]|uniref:SH3 and PX domain-containing protein 2A n=1 Tax=Striga asiatica TaxID=4170 RepID=A0A5A7Q3T4_STRAF|nr:SH3 and PX domain-containing protein 2A [Striga asiatica]